MAGAVIRILLADDQALIRSGIRALLEAEDDIEVVAEATDGRHLDVDQGDVRAVPGGERDRLLSVSRLADDLDVVLGLQQRPDAAADQRLVVSQQDPDHARAGISARTRKPPPACGPACSRPPSADTRSRMPMRPSPRPGAWFAWSPLSDSPRATGRESSPSSSTSTVSVSVS